MEMNALKLYSGQRASITLEEADDLAPESV
jgi:hypothetical protein